MPDNIEKAILVAIKSQTAAQEDFSTWIDELTALTEAAGFLPVVQVIQNRERVQSSTYVGKGKLQEIKNLVEELEPSAVVFDNELTPVQVRNLETALEVPIVDRTMLILKIFAQRARSREGILQVELARMEYMLPRLTGLGAGMSRTGAGIGARGAGEQKLELDRRRIRRKIQDLKQEIKTAEKTRDLNRKRRRRSGIKIVSMVGYTNAGKSSLFNVLCQKAHPSGKPQVEADDRLFQTLDTTTRKIELGPGCEILISDTVGFIQKLPHHLVAAFKSTLEEAAQADLLLHVIDISDPQNLEKLLVVEEVLRDLGAPEDKIIRVYNKIDKLPTPPADSNAIYISARQGSGIPALLNIVQRRLDDGYISI